MLNKKLLNTMQAELITTRVYVFVTLSGVRRVAEVIGINSKTVWVRVTQGCSDHLVVKRHNKRHNVRFYKRRAILNEDVYSTVKDTAGSDQVLDS